MRNREQPDKVRDALIIVCGGIIGVAMVVEAQFIIPNNPIAALLIVSSAALVATAFTLGLARW